MKQYSNSVEFLIYLILSISNIETVFFQILNCVGLVMFDSAVAYLLMAGNLGI